LQKATNGHVFAAIVPGEIDLSLCQVAESVGVELAERLMATEAKEILAEAKRETAKAVIEEKARKDKEAAEKAKQAADGDKQTAK